MAMLVVLPLTYQISTGLAVTNLVGSPVTAGRATIRIQLSQRASDRCLGTTIQRTSLQQL